MVHGSSVPFGGCIRAIRPGSPAAGPGRGPTRFSELVTRIRAIAPLAVLALAAVAGCSDEEGTRPAATVNGEEISPQAVVDELEAIRANEDYLSQIEAQVAVLGEEEGTFDTNFVAQLLGIRIQFALVEAEVEAREVEVDEACTAAATDEMAQQVGGEVILDAFDAEYRDYLVGRFADLVALQSDLAGYPCVLEGNEAVLDTYFEEHREQFLPRCLSVVQFADAAAATAFTDQLAAGGDFATLAAALDPATGQLQDVGCESTQQVLQVFPSLLDFGVGETTPIFDVQGVPAVLHVDSVDEDVEAADVQGDLVAAIGQEIDAAFQEWFSAAVEDAVVEVDPRYGTWDPSTQRIDRPVDDAPSTTAFPLDAEG